MAVKGCDRIRCTTLQKDAHRDGCTMVAPWVAVAGRSSHSGCTVSVQWMQHKKKACNVYITHRTTCGV